MSVELLALSLGALTALVGAVVTRAVKNEGDSLRAALKSLGKSLNRKHRKLKKRVSHLETERKTSNGTL